MVAAGGKESLFFEGWLLVGCPYPHILVDNSTPMHIWAAQIEIGDICRGREWGLEVGRETYLGSWEMGAKYGQDTLYTVMKF